MVCSPTLPLNDKKERCSNYSEGVCFVGSPLCHDYGLHCDSSEFARHLQDRKNTVEHTSRCFQHGAVGGKLGDKWYILICKPKVRRCLRSHFFSFAVNDVKASAALYR